MRERPRGGLEERQRTLLLILGAPAVGMALLAALVAARDASEATRAALLERAREQGRAVEAVLGTAGDSEAGDEVPAGDRASRLDRAGQLVRGLDWPDARVRLVAVGPTDPARADPAVVPADAPMLLVQAVGEGTLRLEHPTPPAFLAEAARAAALPWLALAAVLAVVLGLAHLLLRSRLLVPAAHALDALVEVASGRPVAGGTVPGWAVPRLDAARAGARREAERLAAAEAALAPLEAALEAVGEGVALLDRDDRLLLANGALRDRLAGRPGGSLRPGAPLDRALRFALLALPGAREVGLASGGRMLLVPPGPEAAGATAALPARGGPRLAGMVQEVGEGLAQVARQAVLLHELATDPQTRERAEQLRRAAERCTRAIAPLLAPARPQPPRPVAIDRLVEERLDRLRRGGPTLLAGLAPALPPVSGDAVRLGELLDGLLAALAGGPGAGDAGSLRVRLRRGGAGLLLDLERVEAEEARNPAELALLEHRAREAGVPLVTSEPAPGVRLVRLEWPRHQPVPVEAALGRLVVVGDERGAA
jgi:PAS domain-containing protein